jgi:hypothetical protein
LSGDELFLLSARGLLTSFLPFINTMKTDFRKDAGHDEKETDIHSEESHYLPEDVQGRHPIH